MQTGEPTMKKRIVFMSMGLACLFSERVVGPGDIVIIPATVPHGWIDIADHVDYLSVRPDPDRVLPAGYVNPVIKK
jgi:uncharacterized RmlC-like cupin family protein